MWFELNLVDRGLVNTEAFVLALRHQLSKRPPFGRMAVAADMMTSDQLLRVLKRQVETQQPIGETALQMGFIDKGQLAELLLKQSKEAGTVLESLIDLGLLDEETAFRERRRYLSEAADVSGTYLSPRDLEPLPR